MTSGSVPPQDVAIFGATGHLARTRLWPALYSLTAGGLLAPSGSVIGLARADLDQGAFKEMARNAIAAAVGRRFDERVWDELAQRLSYVSTAADGTRDLAKALQESRHLFYLATPPSAFAPTVRELAAAGLDQGSSIMVEKPFGHDLESARDLDRRLRAVLDESQIYRIDHYLAKETVQNILVFRFGNSVFERVWNRDAIRHIGITVAESAGIEGRGAFYDGVGALRDVAQNHLLQVLALLTMEPPARFTAKWIRDETAKLLSAVRPLDPNCVVRGQYTSGTVAGGQVPGYREEPEIPPESDTETFVAMKLQIDNWRWAGVPIYLRTGKRMPYRATEVEIAFFDAPTSYFDEEMDGMEPNRLILSIDPLEQIEFSFLAKVPGQEVVVYPASMKFTYEAPFEARLVDPYERLICDAMEGDHTLFVRSDAVERCWEIVQPLLDSPPPICFYRAGTWGPPEAERLIDPYHWHLR